MSRPTIVVDKVKHTEADYYGPNSFAFAPVSKDNVMLASFSSCRAYLLDFAHCVLKGKDHYEDMLTGRGEVDFKNIRVLTVGVNADNVNIIEDFLHKFEADCGLEPTEIFKVENFRTAVYLFKGDKLWMHAPMLSLYTLLIRNIAKAHTLKNSWEDTLSSTRVYFESDLSGSLDFVKQIVKYTPKALFGNDTKDLYRIQAHVGYMHDKGIAYFASVIAAGYSCYDSIVEQIKPVKDRLKILENKRASKTLLSNVLKRRRQLVEA